MSQCCDEYLLQAYVDRELAPDQAEAIAAHCHVCKACGQVLRELRVTCEGLRVEAEGVPVGLAERLFEAVEGLRPLEAVTCAQAQEWVSLRLDGELTHEQTQRLQAHLLACGPCYLAANETELVARGLRQVAAEAAPEGLLERVEAAVALATGQPKVIRPTVWRRAAMGLGGAAAAAALLVAMLTRLGPVPVSGPVMAEDKPAPAPVVVAKKTPAPSASRSSAVVERLAPAATSLRAPQTETRVAVTSSSRVAVTPARDVEPARTAPVGPLPAVSVPEVAHETPQPMEIAMLPAAPERTAEPRGAVAAAPAPVETVPRVEAPPPAAREVEPPRPTRVATIEEPVRRPEAAPVRVATRSTWVSREAEPEREVYVASAVPGSRLADARRDLDRDETAIRNSQVRGFVIK